jgi:glycosyltransferase involved in cell wall biosynthesis
MPHKVCILHDFFFSAGGGEKLVLTLARGLGADVYTTHIEKDVIKNLGFEDVKIKSIGDVPKNQFLAAEIATLWYSLRHLPEEYDVYILSGNWAHAASLHLHPSIFYCHTPVRYFYDSKERFLSSFPPFMRSFLRTAIRVHAWYDAYTVKHVDAIVANSQNVQNRIQRYYHRASEIVNPPVDTSKYKFEEIGDYWLSVNRITPDKRIELQCEIFRKLEKEHLVVAGKLERNARQYFVSLNPPPNVKFIGEVSESALISLYAHCKGLITTAIDEDFGMTPLEAMASGKTVLAVDEGGYRETVVHGVTGWLLPARAEAFVGMIQALHKDDLAARKPACIEQAKKFDVRVFVEKMRRIVERTLQ